MGQEAPTALTWISATLFLHIFNNLKTEKFSKNRSA